MKGLLHKEGNGGLEVYKGKKKDDIVVTWDSSFVLVAFKTLGLFNIFHMVASSITNIKGKLQNSMFITHKYMLNKKHDEQRSLCAPGIATCLNPLRTIGLSFVDRISSTIDVATKVSCTI